MNGSKGCCRYGLSVVGCVERSVRSLGRGVLPAALEAVALAIHLQDVDMVGEPVQQRSRQPVLANTSVHSLKGRLIVTSVEPRS